MAYINRHRVTPTTDGSGDATSYTDVASGYVVAIVYTKHGSNPYADGVDFVVTGEQSGIALWTGTDVNATATVMPRGATHSTAGAAALYAAGGTAVNDRIPVAQERIKVVVAQGGATNDGTLDIYVEGS